jgi:hypothetical protein
MPNFSSIMYLFLALLFAITTYVFLHPQRYSRLPQFIQWETASILPMTLAAHFGAKFAQNLLGWSYDAVFLALVLSFLAVLAYDIFRSYRGNQSPSDANGD